MPGVNRQHLHVQDGSGLFPTLQSLDTRTILAVLQLPHRARLTSIARKLSRSADGWYYLLLLPLIALIKPQQAREYIALVLAAFALERSLYFILKNSFRRRRPPAAIAGFQSVITASDRFSLPSGHTSAAFLCTTFLCCGLSWLFAPLYLWASGVGASRVVLGVHFPTDIVLGALLGSSVALYIL
jgi:undecaprenyl-diphosphatase